MICAWSWDGGEYARKAKRIAPFLPRPLRSPYLEQIAPLCTSQTEHVQYARKESKTQAAIKLTDSFLFWKKLGELFQRERLFLRISAENAAEAQNLFEKEVSRALKLFIL
jgi:hypothetical protein